MRTLTIGTQEHTEVVCLDELANDGAYHEYVVYEAVVEKDEDCRSFAKVSFQKGLIKEVGVNGCQHEDVIAMVIDRLEHYQNGKYSCEHNRIALEHLQLSLAWLRKVSE